MIFCFWLRRLFALPAHPLSLSPSLPLLPPAAGKTLAFLLPVVEALFRQRWGKLDGLGALIISPTRELAMQVWGCGGGGAYACMHACLSFVHAGLRLHACQACLCKPADLHTCRSLTAAGLPPATTVPWPADF